MSKMFRVAEIFGPTIQGEGPLVGMPCHFVRFGGCDFRCTWCDTPHAVLPNLVSKLPQMTSAEIYSKTVQLNQVSRSRWVGVKWVVLTGGNPGLLDLSHLIDMFHRGRIKVMVETQGSTYREWYTQVDSLCFSPKPPSSKMDWSFNDFDRILTRLMSDSVQRAREEERETFPMPYLKVPIFTDEDLDFAEEVHARFSLPMFLSIGNDDVSLPTVGNPEPEFTDHPSLTRTQILDNFREILDKVLRTRPSLQDCQIFPQQHVLLWGNERGH